MSSTSNMDQKKDGPDLTPLEKEFLELLRKLDPDQLKMEMAYLRKIVHT